jgi:hypothetical protein
MPVSSLEFMNYQIKILQGLDRGNFAIIIARGYVNLPGFEQILGQVIDASQKLSDCKVLMDFQEAIFQLLPSDLADFLDNFDFKKWPRANKIALLSAPEMQQYRQLVSLGEELAKMQLAVSVFHNMREAIDWLAGIR